MFEIVEKKQLNKTTSLLRIYAPMTAKKAQAGQFVILRADSEGERLPFTITDFDREEKTVSIVFKTVGAGTLRLSKLNVQIITLNLATFNFTISREQHILT